AGRPGETDSLLQAIELHRGPLLAGYYDDWILPERQRLADLYTQALRRLAHGFCQAGDLDRALDCARRAVNADPLREETHADRTRCLITAGQPAAGRRQYRELERVLADELGTSPSTATRALARQIESGGVEERKSGSSGDPVDPASSTPPLVHSSTLPASLE